MKNKFMLSIIIPAYNLEKYISNCLNSILTQIKNDKVEIIIVNDGSKDKTENICNYYCQNYSFIKYFYQKNSGVSSARNLGLSKAKGKYVWFIDGDDLIYPDSLNKILSVLNKNYDIIIGDMVKSYNGKTVLNKKRNGIKLSNGKVNLLSLWSNIIKRDFINKNRLIIDENLKYTEDMDFVLSALSKTDNIYFLDEIIYIYNQTRNESATKKKNSKRVLDMLYFIDKWSSYEGNLVISKKEIQNFVSYQYYIALAVAYSIENPKEREMVIDKLKQKKQLFLCNNSKKGKIIKKIYKLFGLKLTGKLLSVWLTIKK